jgi:hypothetical protein
MKGCYILQAFLQAFPESVTCKRLTLQLGITSCKGATSMMLSTWWGNRLVFKTSSANVVVAIESLKRLPDTPEIQNIWEDL